MGALIGAGLLGMQPAQATTYTWVGSVSNDWTNPANWSPSGVPGSGDSVVIQTGTPTLNVDWTVGGLSMSGGTVSESRTLQINGLATFGDGVGYNLETLTGGGSVNLNGGALDQGYLLDLTTNTLNNTSGSTFTSKGWVTGLTTQDNQIGSGGNGTFNNAGSFVQDAAGHTTTIYAAFNNAGSVTVKSGALALADGGTQSGSFVVGAGTALAFAGGIHNFANGSSISNAGTLMTSSGVVNLTGSGVGYTGSGVIDVAGGTLNVNLATALNPAQVVIGGSGVLNAASAINAGSLAFTSGTLGGTLNVTGQATFGDGLGYQAQTLAPGGTLKLAGPTTDQSNSLTLAGTLNNAVGATFTSKGWVTGTNVQDNYIYGGGTFNNLGTFVQDASGHATTIYAVFNNSGTVNVNSGALSLAGGGKQTGAYTAGSGATLAFSGGVHNFVSGASINNLGTLMTSGGLVNLSGAGVSYTGNGVINAAGGELDIDLATALTPSLVVVSGGTLNIGSTVTASSLDFASGNLGGTLKVSGPSMFGDGASYKAQTLVGGGTLNLSGSATDVSNSLTIAGTLNNTAGSTFTSNGWMMGTNTQDSFIYGGGVFNNAGTFVQSAAGHTTTVYSSFNDTGSVSVTSGALSLAGGGTHTGSFSIGAGTALAFSGGVDSFAGRASITNAGTLMASGGTVNLEGSAVTYKGKGAINAAGGTLNIDLATALTPTQVLISGGTLNIGSSVTATSLSFSSGTLGGTLQVTGQATLGDGASYRAQTVAGGGTLNLAGGGTDQSDSFTLAGTLNNAAGSTFSSKGWVTGTNVQDSYVYGGGTFNNAGSFVQNAAGHTTTVYSVFNNTGSVTVNSGALVLAGGGLHSGSFTIRGGTALGFEGGVHGFTSGSSISNAGTLVVSGDNYSTTNLGGSGVSYSGTGVINVAGGDLNINLASAINPSQIVMSGGVLAIGSTVTAGSLGFAGGTLGGTLKVSGQAVFGDGASYRAQTLAGGGVLNLTGGAIEESDSFTLAGTLNNAVGSVFTSKGFVTGTTAQDNYIYGGGTFNNAGSFVQNAAGHVTTMYAAFNNTGTYTQLSGSVYFAGGGNHPGSLTAADPASGFANSGQVTIGRGTVMSLGTGLTFGQTDGMMDIDGTLASAAIDVRGGQLQGTGTVVGALNNLAGLLAPGDGLGTLTVAGNYTQGAAAGHAPGGRLAMDIASTAAGDYDHVAVTGTATLAGELDVHFDAGYAASAGESFSLMSYAGHSGEFDTVSVSGLQTGYGYTLDYTPTGLTLSVMAVPEPATMLLWMAGLAGIGAASRRKLAPRE